MIIKKMLLKEEKEVSRTQKALALSLANVVNTMFSILAIDGCDSCADQDRDCGQ